MFPRLRLIILSVLRSILHYKRAYGAVGVGALLASFLLTGSLLTGSSVRLSLQAQADRRTGAVAYALRTRDGFFPAHLASRLGARVRTSVVPALELSGTASRAQSGAALIRVRIYGVPDSFYSLFSAAAASEPAPAPLERRAFLSPAASRALSLREGDELILQAEKRSPLPIETVPGRSDDRFVPLRLTVADVLPPDRGGFFTLETGQASPLSVFVPWELLARTVGLRGKANLLLVRERTGGGLPLADLTLALQREMTPADYGLHLRRIADGRFWELRDERLFIRPAAEEAARALDKDARGRLVYFVNGAGGAPYSFAAAVEEADLPTALREGEIIVSDWLASDRRIRRGDKITLSYYAVGPGSVLVEREAHFTIRAVLPQTHPVFDARFTPDFPGLSEAAACRDWRTGIPIDFSRIRPKDEAFWNAFHASPKVVIRLDEGRKLWANRYGGLTSIFIRSSHISFDPYARLRERLVPATFGFTFTPVREAAAAAVAGGVDLTGLFAGLSFFAVAAAVILASFLFAAAVADRRSELGLLRAVGFSRTRLLFRFGLEGAVVACAGIFAGSLLAPVFTGAMILLLRTLFSGAVGEAELGFFFSPADFFIGMGLSLLFSLAAFGMALVRETRRPPVALLSGTVVRNERRGKPRRLVRLAFSAAAVGAALWLTVGMRTDAVAPHSFFASSVLFFVGLMFIIDAVLLPPPRRTAVFAAAPGRSLASLRGSRVRTSTSVLIIALGVFLVTAVGANTASLPADPDRRDSGTGGFAFYVETIVPLPENINEEAARRRYGLDDLPSGVSFVPLRVSAGDDSSCLNLNRAQSPEVVGVPQASLAERKAFSFTGTISALPGGMSPWTLLAHGFDAGTAADVIPVIADGADLEWGFGRALGDETVVKDEGGRERRLRFQAALCDSLFQGSLVVSEENFLALYPSAGGYTRFLVDAPGMKGAARDALAVRLREALRPYGVDVTTAAERLFRYQRVANTYLLMFLVLGGLGLMFGLGGYGVFIRLSAARRRGEFALMRAVGIPEHWIFRTLLVEHLFVLAAAFIVGLSAAFSALLPALLKAPDRLPWAALGGLVIAMAAGGYGAVRRAVRRALAGDLIASLKNE